mmetsp:Transcript_105900/g.182661  ORF Transcript_105900/g.182661 Transcript_105900/m.182661 type:complete len:108 (-) Transcript_105900:40-363(-)
MYPLDPKLVICPFQARNGGQGSEEGDRACASCTHTRPCPSAQPRLCIAMSTVSAHNESDSAMGAKKQTDVFGGATEQHKMADSGYTTTLDPGIAVGREERDPGESQR